MSRSLSFWQAFVLGAAVLGSLAIGSWLMLRIGSKSTLWNNGYELVLELPDAQELELGTPVRIRGVEAGEVIAIEDPVLDGDNSYVRVRMRLKHKYRDRIYADSQATIVSKGLLGTSYIAIHPGHPISGRLASNVIRFEPVRDLSARANEVLEKADRIILEIEQGKGSVGKLMKDESLYSDIRTGVTEIRALVKNTNEAVIELRQDARKTLNGATQSLIAVQEELAGVREFVRSGQEAIVAIKQDAEAIKSMPIIRSYVEDAVQILVRPDRIRDSVYYVEEDLFEPGKTVLSEAGRNRLQKVADWLNSNKKKNSDIVVVSYADSSIKGVSPAAARAVTRKQSEIVAEYLRERGVHKMGTFSRREVTSLGMGFDPSPVTDKERLPPQRTEIILFVPQ